MAREARANAAGYFGPRLPIKLLAFIAVADGTSWLLGRDLVTQFQLDIYRTASTRVPELESALHSGFGKSVRAVGRCRSDSGERNWNASP